MKYMLFLFLGYFFMLSCSEDSNSDPIELPRLTIDGLTVMEEDISRPFFIPVRLSDAPTDTVFAFVQSIDGTAKAGEDYTVVSEETVIFLPGDSREDLRIEIVGDDEVEEDEEFILEITNADGATIEQPEAIVTIENDDWPDPVIPQSGYSSPESYAGMELVWRDEFQNEIINESDWNFETGNGENGWGNEELEFYKRENAYLLDGYLIIEAREENAGGFEYTSARMVSRPGFRFTYGRVDIRASLPEGKGVWPALWMLGNAYANVGWPKCGEIDIMEIIGSEPNTLHGTAHYSRNNQHVQSGGQKTVPNGSLQNQFHVYSIIWNEDKITWLLDDQAYYEMDITPDYLTEFHADFFFIFNVAVGGIWPGSPNASTVFPQWMIVDYVRVFQ